MKRTPPGRTPPKNGTWMSARVAGELAGVPEHIVRHWMQIGAIPTDYIRGQAYTDMDSVRAQVRKGAEPCN